MTQPIIRAEAQVTPVINMFDVEQYPWAVYQIVDNVRINLHSGFEDTLHGAVNQAHYYAQQHNK